MSRSVCTNRSSIVLMSLEKKPMALVLFAGAWVPAQNKNGQQPALFRSATLANVKVPGTFKKSGALPTGFVQTNVRNLVNAPDLVRLRRWTARSRTNSPRTYPLLENTRRGNYRIPVEHR